MVGKCRENSDIAACQGFRPLAISNRLCISPLGLRVDLADRPSWCDPRTAKPFSLCLHRVRTKRRIAVELCRAAMAGFTRPRLAAKGERQTRLRWQLCWELPIRLEDAGRLLASRAWGIRTI